MNSFKKRPSQLLTIILVLAMLVSMLAGCKKDDTAAEADPSLPAPNINLVDDATEPADDSTEPSKETEPLADNIAIVIADQLTVRSGPSEDKNPIGTLDKGTHVEILRTEEVNKTMWALIREGWIPMEFVEMANGADSVKPEETKPVEETTTKEEEPAATQSIKGVITGDGLNIRSEPTTKGEIKGSYSKGDTVTILETKNGWGRTDKGWISMQYVNTGNAENATANNDNKDNNDNGTTGTTTDGTAYFVTVDGLNIRSTNSTNGDIKGQYNAGDKVIVTETKDGWGKTDKGWISMTYAYKTGAKGTNGCNGVVIGDQLNVRSGPGTGYNGVGSLTYGARVNVLQRITVGGVTWGCTEKGWICMDYVYIDGTEGEHSGTGTILGDQLNIRSGPGTGYGSVGSLNKGDTVEILEQIKIGNTTWGCINKGWICMDYVSMG